MHDAGRQIRSSLEGRGSRRRIGLVAHDNKKLDLVEWCRYNQPLLRRHELIATGTTGALLSSQVGLPVGRLHSGPLGGDLQMGALITEGAVDVLLFFWDPLEAQPHDPDIKALLRICAVWNVPVACNRATADYLVSSPLLESGYSRSVPDYTRLPAIRDDSHKSGVDAEQVSG